MIEHVPDPERMVGTWDLAGRARRVVSTQSQSEVLLMAIVAAEYLSICSPAGKNEVRNV